MDVRRLQPLAGFAFILIGVMLAVASVTSVGAARGWNVADAFAADSIRSLRRAGMLLSVTGLAALVAVTPFLVARTSGTPGSGWTLAGWLAFSFGAALFFLALGVVSITLPALGELAQTGAVSPQAVADRMTRQAPILLAFLGGNLMFLSWFPLGVGLARAEFLPPLVGWFLAATAITAWLGFLHVPVMERFGSPLWPLALVLLGTSLLRHGPADI